MSHKDRIRNDKYRVFRGKDIEVLLIPNTCHQCGKLMSHHLDKSGTIFIGCPTAKQRLDRN
jgi:hypothetical protein